MAERASARLTDSRIRNAKRAEQPYKLTDGGGLYLAVQPTGAKCWRYRYRIAGRENLFAIGEYPAVTLQEARTARDRARELVKQGIHPAAERRAHRLVVATQAADTFAAIAGEWIEQNQAGWSAYYLSQVRTVFAHDVFPDIGKLPIKSVRAAHLLAILKRVERRGAPTIAVLIRQWTSAVFRYAVANLRAESDPATALKGAVTKPRAKHKHALTQNELPEFLRKLSNCDATPQVTAALQLLMLTFVRPKELREASWSEFDLKSARWEIPAQRMKMRTPHVVPLSKQAVQLLQQVEALTGSRSLLFPNRRDPRRPMSPMTLNRSLERMGYGGYFSAHAFRATASTHLNAMGWSRDAIERQLAHQERNRTRASYNHAEYLDERARMMQAWADFLEGLKPTGSAIGAGGSSARAASE